MSHAAPLQRRLDTTGLFPSGPVPTQRLEAETNTATQDCLVATCESVVVSHDPLATTGVSNLLADASVSNLHIHFQRRPVNADPFRLFLLTLRPDTARRTPTRRPQRAAPHPHATHAPATTSGCASSPGGEAMSAGGESMSLFSILSNSLRMSSKERAGVLLAVLDASLQVCAHAQPSR